MTSRDRLVLAVVAAVAVLGGFWFLALKPKRAEVSAAREKTEAAQTKLDAAQAGVASGRAAQKNYLANYARVAKLGKAVPVSDDVPALVYQINDIADKKRCASGTASTKANDCKHTIDFSKIELTPGTDAAPAAGSGAGAAASSAVTATLPPGASVGAAGFPTMPFTFSFDGSFFTLESFLGDVNKLVAVDKKKGEDGITARGRLLQIDGIKLQPGPKGFPDVTAEVNATAYLLPADEGLTAGATPGGPAGAESAAPSGTAATTSGTQSNRIESAR